MNMKIEIKKFFKNNCWTLAIIFGILIGLYYISRYNYLLYHSLVELFSIVIAFGIFVLSWNSRRFLENNYLKYIGVAYLFVGLIGLLHTFAYKGIGIFQGFYGANLATQLWISARYIESISILFAFIILNRKLLYYIQFITYLVVSFFIIFTIFYWKVFPDCYIEGYGLTKFKIISEYIIIFILLLSILFLNLLKAEFSRKIFFILQFSIIFTIFSEVLFTLYNDVYGIFNFLGHIFMLISFFLLYKAIIETGVRDPINLLFFKIKKNEETIFESEKLFKSLFVTAYRSVCLIEKHTDSKTNLINFKIADINNSFSSMFGIERQYAINKSIDLVFSEDSIEILKIIKKFEESKEKNDYTFFSKSRNKYYLVVVFEYFPEKFSIVFEDITQDVKEKEANIKYAKFSLENPDPIFRIDSELRVLFANKPGNDLLKTLNYKKGQKASFLDIKPGLVIDSYKESATKIGKNIYSFLIFISEDKNEYNVYGRNITEKIKNEKLHTKLIKEKTILKERNKIAGDLHDTVSQTLFSSNLIIESIRKSITESPADVINLIDRALELNNAASLEIRSLLYELKPLKFMQENISNLIKKLADIVLLKHNIAVDFSSTGNYEYPYKIKYEFYRIAQEIINNISKHSHATMIIIYIKSSPKTLRLDIIDNGIGFYLKRRYPKSFGINVMEDRAKAIGASLNIESQPGSGTKVSLIYSRSN